MDRRAYRLVPAAVGAWVVAGVTTAVPGVALVAAPLLWGAVLLSVALVCLWRDGRTRATRVVAAVSFALAAATASAVAFAEPARTQIARVASDVVEVQLTVTGKVERTATGVRADAVADRIRTHETELATGTPVTVLLEDRMPGLDVGARLRASATAFAAETGRRAVLVIRVDGETAQIEPPAGVLAAAAGLRTSLAEATRELAEPGAGLVPGLAVGDTSGVDEHLDEVMKVTSLSHLTAVSGANCAIVVGLAFVLAAACRATRVARIGAGVGALVGFVVLVTPEPSVVRAATMSLVAMGGLLLGRRGAGLAVLSLAVTLLLVLDPWLSSSLGFALSVAATAALLVLAPPLGRGLSSLMPQPLAVAVAVPLSAQLACGPLIVLIAPEVSTYGVLANMLAAPAAPAATVVGLAACLAAPVPLVQAGLAALAWVPAAWIAATAETVAALPGSALPWPAGPPGLIGLAAAGAIVALALVPPGRHRFAGLLRGIAGLVATAGIGLVSGAVVVTAVVVPMGMPRDWSIAMCDVGQGDAVLLRSEGRTMLVDTGPEPAALRSCLDRLGIGTLDILVLTHFDTDHVGGVDAAAGRVDLLLHGPREGPEHERVISRVGASRSIEASAGLRGGLGEASWRVLWPIGAAFAPGNDASVVVEVAGGGVPRTILLGDLGAAAQRVLHASGTLHPPYDVVKVSHHGSADQDAGLYLAVGADLALVPVGADNRYGHPRDEALAAARATGAVIARTDRDGLVLLGREAPADEGARLTVWRERGRPRLRGCRPGSRVVGRR